MEIVAIGSRLAVVLALSVAASACIAGLLQALPVRSPETAASHASTTDSAPPQAPTLRAQGAWYFSEFPFRLQMSAQLTAHAPSPQTFLQECQSETGSRLSAEVVQQLNEILHTLEVSELRENDLICSMYREYAVQIIVVRSETTDKTLLCGALLSLFDPEVAGWRSYSLVGTEQSGDVQSLFPEQSKIIPVVTRLDGSGSIVFQVGIASPGTNPKVPVHRWAKVPGVDYKVLQPGDEGTQMFFALKESL